MLTKLKTGLYVTTGIGLALWLAANLAGCAGNSCPPGLTSVGGRCVPQGADDAMDGKSMDAGDGVADGSTGCTGCDPKANCNTASTTPRCVCRDNLIDVAGDGSECVTPCDLAECSEFAQCTADGQTAACQCTSPYVGDGTSCQFDATCAQLNCDDHAECVVTGDTRECRCLKGYDGNGTTCSNIDDCSDNPCAHGGECSDLVNGFSCDCTDTGYEGSTCTKNVDDCSDSPCDNGGACTDLVNGFSCDCTGTGYEGPTCADNTDDCSGNPCDNGGVCTDEINGFSCNCAVGYSGSTCSVDSCDPDPCDAEFACSRTMTGPLCTPVCDSECQLGEPCLKDSHCADGLSCDPNDRVCVGACSGAVLTSAADIVDLHFCKQIDGDLTIEPVGTSFTVISASDFPYLTTINGSIICGGVDDTELVSVTMNALQTVTGAITFQSQPGMTLISLPALTSVGTTTGAGNGIAIEQGTTGSVIMPELTTVNGNISFGLSSLDSVEMGKLQMVTGNLSFGDSPMPVSNVDLGSLQTVNGNMTVRYLFRLPYTDISNLDSVGVGGTKTFNEIGCCFINSSASLTYMCSGTYTDYQSYCN